MNFNSFLKTITNKLVKLQAISTDPFKEPPLTPEEKQMPIGGLLADRPKQLPKDVLEPLPKAPDAAHMLNQPNVVNVQKWYKIYLSALELNYKEFSKDVQNPNKKQIKNLADEFLEERKNNLRIIHNPIEKKEHEAALTQLHDDFVRLGDAIFMQAEAIVPQQKARQEEVKKPHLDKNRNYTENEIRAYIKAIAILNKSHAVNAEALAIEICKNLPEFTENEHNMQILEQIEGTGLGRHKTLKPAAISDSEREGLFQIFMDSYLDPVKNKDNWKKITGIVENVSKAAQQQQFEIRGNIDIAYFLSERLFRPNLKNKELFLGFFMYDNNLIKDRVSNLWNKAQEEYLSASDLNSADDEAWKQQNRAWSVFATDISAGQEVARVWSFMQQNEKDLFVNEIKSIMQNPNDELHDVFFNWVCYKIFSRSLQEHISSQSSLAKGDNIEEEQNELEQKTEEEKATSARGFDIQKFTDKLVNVNTLNSCRDYPKLKKGDVPNIRYFDCLAKDWQKVSGYMKMIFTGLQTKYNNLPKVTANQPKIDSDIANEKMQILQKMFLWKKLYEVVKDTMQNVLRAKDRQNAPLSEDMVIRILNRRWYDVIDNKVFHNVRFDKEDESVIKYCEKGATDTGMSYDEVYAKLFGESATEYRTTDQIHYFVEQYVDANIGTDPKLRELVDKYGKISFQVIEYLQTKKEFATQYDQMRENSYNFLNSLMQKASYGISDLKDILLSPEALSEFGGDTVLTFIEMLKLRPDLEYLGILTSKQNFGTYKEKMDYLWEILQREGVEFDVDGVKVKRQKDEGSVSLEEIDKLTPTQIDAIFSVISSQLQLIYGGTSALKDALSNPKSSIPDDFVEEMATKAGITDVKSKKDYAAAKLKVKNQINAQFVKTQLGKYHIETDTIYGAYVAWLAKYIQTAMNNKQFLEANGFADRDSFLTSIEISPTDVTHNKTKQTYEDIYGILESFSRKKSLSIGAKYFVDLKKAYDKRILKKTDVKAKEDYTIEKIIMQLTEKINGEGELPSDLRFGTSSAIPDGLFYGEILDTAAKHLHKMH